MDLTFFYINLTLVLQKHFGPLWSLFWSGVGPCFGPVLVPVLGPLWSLGVVTFIIVLVPFRSLFNWRLLAGDGTQVVAVLREGVVGGGGCGNEVQCVRWGGWGGGGVGLLVGGVESVVCVCVCVCV